MFRSATIESEGTVGWTANHREPRRPFSSAVTNTSSMLRRECEPPTRVLPFREIQERRAARGVVHRSSRQMVSPADGRADPQVIEVPDRTTLFLLESDGSEPRMMHPRR